MPDVMHTLTVDLGSRADDRSYPISIGRGLLSDSAHWQTLVEHRGVVLVTDDRVAPLYAEQLKAALGSTSLLTEIVLPAGSVIVT